MKPCTSINLFFDSKYIVPVAEQMQRTADGGFIHLDMNFWDWSYGDLSPFRQDNWRDWVKGIKEAAERMYVTFTQAHAHVYNFYQNGTDGMDEEMMRRSIEGAGMLGIPWIVMHPSQRPDWEESGSLDKMLAENVAYLKKHAEKALEFGTGLALENMSRPAGGLTSAQQLCTLIDMIDMPNVGACWDTGHANLARQNQPESIRTLGHRLHALHIADNAGVNDDHVLPFFGNINWPPIVAALHEINYDGDFTFEGHNIVRRMPENCKGDAVKLQYRIGETLANY